MCHRNELLNAFLQEEKVMRCWADFSFSFFLFLKILKGAMKNKKATNDLFVGRVVQLTQVIQQIMGIIKILYISFTML